MTFNLYAFVEILKTLGPFVLAATGVPAALIPLIVHGIELAEGGKAAFSGVTASGATKKAYVLDAVDTVLSSINAGKPGTVVPGYAAAVSGGIDATVAVINLIRAQQANNAQPSHGPTVS